MEYDYGLVDEFEKAVAKYAGSQYGVAVNSCTNAILLSVKYDMHFGHCDGSFSIPHYTYVGVPYAIMAAGAKVKFYEPDRIWSGQYDLDPHILTANGGICIVDSARRFTRGMYHPYTFYCLSFHSTKTLAIGDGGMILTDSKERYDRLRQMRFDGRTPGLSVFDDDFTLPSFHCNMKPPIAQRGLELMEKIPDINPDLPGEYPDLTKYPIFQEVV